MKIIAHWNEPDFEAMNVGGKARGVGCVGILGIVSIVWGLRFLKSPKNGKPFEALSGVWTIALYVMLGIVPMLLRKFMW